MRREQVLRELGLGPGWVVRNQESGIRNQESVPPLVEVCGSGFSPTTRSSIEVGAEVPRRVLGEVAAPVVQIDAAQCAAAVAGMGWDELNAAIAACRACVLCEKRRQAVPGVGDARAEWLFVGEGPGAEEDERGEPFVGQAGKLLDAMLAAIHLKRGENVYIANAVKCRPPGNRPPEAAEMAACRPFLQRQIELLQPKLIVALGRQAAQTLLGREIKLGAVRGQVFDFEGRPLIVTYHPAYLLRNLPDKAKAWEDLLFMRRTHVGLPR